jgi:DNA-binding Lrp family transcriptional regulator
MQWQPYSTAETDGQTDGLTGADTAKEDSRLLQLNISPPQRGHMTEYLDEVDRRIIYALMDDARNTSAPMIAEDLNVSAGTIRNRIERLEEEGVIRGYTAIVDFERAGGRMTAVFICTAPGAEREQLALAVQSIPGVIHVRVLMLGRPDLQVVAVGEDTNDLRRIAEALADLDIEIDDEELVQTQLHSPYQPFGPTDAEGDTPLDRIELVDGTDLLELSVQADAPAAGHSLRALHERGLVPEDVVIISVERDDEVTTPSEDMTLRVDDILTVLPRGVPEEAVLDAVLGERHAE